MNYFVTQIQSYRRMGCAASRSPPFTTSDLLRLGVPGFADTACDADLRRKTLNGTDGSFVMVDVNADDARVYACGRGRRRFSGETGLSTLTLERESDCLAECLSRGDCRGARWGTGGRCDLVSSARVVCTSVGSTADRFFLKKDAPFARAIGDTGSSAFAPAIGMIPPGRNYAAPYVGAGAPVSIKYTPWQLGAVLLLASVVCGLYAGQLITVNDRWRVPVSAIVFVLSVTVAMVVLANL